MYRIPGDLRNECKPKQIYTIFFLITGMDISLGYQKAVSSLVMTIPPLILKFRLADLLLFYHRRFFFSTHS